MTQAPKEPKSFKLYSDKSETMKNTTVRDSMAMQYSHLNFSYRIDFKAGWDSAIENDPDIQALKRDVERLRGFVDPHTKFQRANIEYTVDGIVICFGFHEKSEPCSWHKYIDAEAHSKAMEGK